MNEEQPSTEQAVETPHVEAPPTEAAPVEPPLRDPRRRLRELLAIPDRDRTDALWDEIIGLEIELAPGNRAQSPQSDNNNNNGRRQEPGRRPEQQGRRPEQQGQRQDPSRSRPGKRFFKGPKRGPGAQTKR